EGLVAADLNGDHQIDLGLLNGSSVASMLGDGDGGFATAPGPIELLGGPSSSGAIVLGDFNGDGDPDFVVTRPSADELFVFVSHADGSIWGAGSPLPIGATTQPVVADFNHDGKLDLAVGTSGGIAVLLGNGSGGFSAAPGSPIRLGDVTSIEAGPFGAGEQDLAATVAGAPGVDLLLGDGAGGFR